MTTDDEAPRQVSEGVEALLAHLAHRAYEQHNVLIAQQQEIKEMLQKLLEQRDAEIEFRIESLRAQQSLTIAWHELAIELKKRGGGVA